jgi:hypothetical protein
MLVNVSDFFLCCKTNLKPKNLFHKGIVIASKIGRDLHLWDVMTSVLWNVMGSSIRKVMAVLKGGHALYINEVMALTRTGALFLGRSWTFTTFSHWKVIGPVRQLLQSATPPHWGTSPMVVRAIPGPTYHRIPTGNQTGSNSVLRAAIFIQLLA